MKIKTRAGGDPYIDIVYLMFEAESSTEAYLLGRIYGLLEGKGAYIGSTDRGPSSGEAELTLGVRTEGEHGKEADKASS